MKVLKSKSGFRLAVVFALAASALTLSLLFAIDPPPPYFIVNDLDGANDEPGQKDINSMGRYDDDTAPGYLDFFWSWDESISGGSTLDACGLFDSDGDANANFAICGQVGSNNKLVAGSPKAYSCQDTDKLHCKTPFALNPVGDDLLAGTLAAWTPPEI
jgi:hypothetical protein